MDFYGQKSKFQFLYNSHQKIWQFGTKMSLEPPKNCQNGDKLPNLITREIIPYLRHSDVRVPARTPAFCFLKKSRVVLLQGSFFTTLTKGNSKFFSMFIFKILLYCQLKLGFYFSSKSHKFSIQ